jgi:hypothetical protein
MKLRLAMLAAVVAAVAVAAGIAYAGTGPTSPGQGRGPSTYTIGLFGDTPYNALGARSIRTCSPTSMPRTCRSRSSTAI